MKWKKKIVLRLRNLGPTCDTDKRLEAYTILLRSIGLVSLAVRAFLTLTAFVKFVCVFVQLAVTLVSKFGCRSCHY